MRAYQLVEPYKWEEPDYLCTLAKDYIRIRDIVRTETAAGLRASHERQTYMTDLDRKIKQGLEARSQK